MNKNMNEQDILDLISEDPWMMNILQIAEKQHLSDWAIGAGFIRNKIWNHLHGYKRQKVDTADIDFVYFDPNGNDEEKDKILSEKLNKETNLDWEIVNETYAHKWNNLPPYKSMQDAISQWPETATAIGVRLMSGKLELIAPHGISDLINLIVKPTPSFKDLEKVKKRAEQKHWFEKWPKLKFES